MPTTLNHNIYYPAGNVAPNVPLAMQTLAESTEAAISGIVLAPLIICTKNDGQTLATANTVYDIKFDDETHSQGIEHTPGSATFTVSQTGVYQINTRVAFNGANTIGTIMINVNGTNMNSTLSDMVGSASAWPKPLIFQYVKLNAGDIVKVVGYSNVANTTLSSQSNFQLAKVAGF